MAQQSLEMEEAEGLVSSSVGNGGTRGSSTPPSVMGEIALLACEPRNRKNIITFAFVASMLLLILAANMGGSGGSADDDDIQINFVDTMELATKTPAWAAVPEPIVSESKIDITIVDATSTEIKVDVTDDPTKEQPKEKTKKKPSKVALLEPDVQTGRADEATRDAESEKWGSWHFWDGESARRPQDDFCGKYPNRDIPANEFPDTSWQVDAVYVNHFLNDGDKLIQRAMEAIFSEYGKGKPLPPEKLSERHKMFHWEKIDFTTSPDPPDVFKKNGSREIGGWTTKRSFDGLVRRLLHAMLTQDTFTVVLAGHSAAQGQGNHFRQSYMMQFHRIMKPIFQRLGVKLITRNISFGGLGTIHSSMGSRDILGKDVDLMLWDSGMTENGNQHHIDLFMRQALMAGNRVPILWANGPFDLLKMLHENVDADVGEFGNGSVGIEPVRDEEQAMEVPWAARFVTCVDERQDLCSTDRFRATCWINRTDGIMPERTQRDKLEGQVKWHPGWRVHQLQGRVLAFAVLEGLEVALNLWMERTMTGQPLDDHYWHVTEYYNNIRDKVMNLDPSLGHCHEIDGSLPSRMCSTPMNGRTQYTPRADYDVTSLTSIIKPADNGYVPKNNLVALYEGLDEHNPNFDVPEGEIDVASIVSNRRLLEATFSHDRAPMEAKPAKSMVKGIMSLDPTTNSILNRRLDEAVVPGKGWEVLGEPQGRCDGTYEEQCGRSTDNDCVMSGHHCARGAVVGNEWSGWLVMVLKDLKAGIIVIKLHTWYEPDEQLMTAGWTSVNGEHRRRRLGSPDETISDVDLAAMDMGCSMARELKSRAYKTPPLPDTFMFDYAINGKVTSLNATEFLDGKREVARIVETWTLLDDPAFTTDPQDVEVAIRLRGSERRLAFGVSHIYWA